MTQSINIHAACVSIGGKGVLLLGASGAGKSDVALRLIDGGAKLVADDRTVLTLKRGVLHAAAPDTIKGLLEVRGVGIIALPAMSAPVKLAVRLGREGARLPEPECYSALGAAVPLIRLDARFPATPAKIRAALAAFSQERFRDTFVLKKAVRHPK